MLLRRMTPIRYLTIEADEHQDPGGLRPQGRSPNDFDFCQRVPSDASMLAQWLLVEMGDEEGGFSR
jgi:hypothetical protein